MLIISDPHFGKTAHFQKHGISVSSAPFQKDLDILENLIFEFQPKVLLILGDFFHSDINKEWEHIYQMLKGFMGLKTILVKGNHDTKISKLISHSDIILVDELIEENIIFSHFPVDKLVDNQYNIHGHLHPSITISGRGKQNITLPCFVFGKQYGIMPAFGSFTGNFNIIPKSSEKIFLLTGEKVLNMNSRAD